MKEATTIRFVVIWIVLMFLCLALFIVHLSRAQVVGLPECAGTLLERTGYTVCHNDQGRLPFWTRHFLSPDDIANRPVARTNDFRADRELPEEARSQNSDYLRSGYDRGHLVPASDRGATRKLMSETFLLSNMAPETPEMNRQIWRTAVEIALRNHVKETGCNAEVYTGVLIQSQQPKKIGNVQVPTHVYKMALCDGETHVILLPNAKEFLEPERYFTSVDEIERLTGADFYNEPEEVESKKQWVGGNE